MRSSSKLVLLFSYSAALLFIATLSLALADDYFEYNCSINQGNFAASSVYQTNLNTIISQLSSPTQFNYGFFNLSTGKTPDDQVYATGLCRGDQDQDGCYKCLNYTANELRQFCPLSKGATAWSEFCQVRYSNQIMFGQLENDPRTCVFNPNNASNPDQLNAALNELLVKLNSKAAAGGSLRKYAADSTTYGDQQQIYAMVQCSPDMDQQNCSTCLSFARKEFTSCCSGRLGCRVLRPTCTLRFENSSFYENPVPVPSASPASLPSPTDSPSVTPTRGMASSHSSLTWAYIIITTILFVIIL